VVKTSAPFVEKRQELYLPQSFGISIYNINIYIIYNLHIKRYCFAIEHVLFGYKQAKVIKAEFKIKMT